MTKETEFVKHIRKHLEEYGFSLVFGKGRRVNVGGARCEGYFNYGKTKKKDALLLRERVKPGSMFLLMNIATFCNGWNIQLGTQTNLISPRIL